MRKILKNILLSLGFILCLGSVNSFARSCGVDIFLNGEKTNLGKGAIINKGRVLVPLREIYHMKKYTILQDADKGRVRIEKGFKYVEFTVGLDKVTFNNREEYIDVKPVIMYNKTYIPLRVFEEALGNDIKWNSEKGFVTIEEKEYHLEFNLDEEVEAKKIAMLYYNEDVVFVERKAFGENECYVFARSKAVDVPSIAVEKNGASIYLVKKDYNVYKVLGVIVFNS